MDVVKLAISKPVGVTVGVLLLVMFGLIGLTAIPIQLTPTVDRPDHHGRDGLARPEPAGDRRRDRQEAGGASSRTSANLKRMTSVSSQGSEHDHARVLHRHRASPGRGRRSPTRSGRCPTTPSEVEEPKIKVADGASENAIAWIITDLDPDMVAISTPGFDITHLYNALDKEVKPELERIEGVAEVNIYGGREREARVYVDNFELAQRGLNHVELVDALRGENRNVSAGTIAESKRDYRVRLIGQYEARADPRDGDRLPRRAAGLREGRREVELGTRSGAGSCARSGTPRSR
jgi:HAE1 family hydrophobic/amphiphilic exporter-1